MVTKYKAKAMKCCTHGITVQACGVWYKCSDRVRQWRRGIVRRSTRKQVRYNQCSEANENVNGGSCRQVMSAGKGGGRKGVGNRPGRCGRYVAGRTGCGSARAVCKRARTNPDHIFVCCAVCGQSVMRCGGAA